MGMLGAFLRGAAGQGLINESARMQRDSEQQRAALMRQQEIEQERAWRTEQAALDRQARGSAGRATSAAAAAKEAQAAATADSMTTAQISRATGADGTMARGMLERFHQGGPNPYTRTEQEAQAIDDGDRKRHVTTTQTVPDIERWDKLNRIIAESILNAGAYAEGNPERASKARLDEQQRDAGMLAMERPDLAPTVAMGMAAGRGSGAYGKGGVNEFTGAADAVGQSQITENVAQAGQANRANQLTAIEKMPPQVKLVFDSLIDEAKRIDAAMLKEQADPLGGWDPRKNPNQAAMVVRMNVARDKADELLARYLPDGGKSPAAAAFRERLLGGGESGASGTPPGAAAQRSPETNKSDTYAAGRPVGGAAAAEIRAREASDRTARTTQAAAKASAEASDLSALRAEAERITLDEIRRMSSKRAAEVYGRYGAVLPETVLVELRRRM